MALARLHRQVDVSCADCSIRHRAICALCGPDHLEELNRIKSYRRFEPGETIAWAGERLAMVGSVVEGVAMLSSTLADGRRQMVGLLLPRISWAGLDGRSIPTTWWPSPRSPSAFSSGTNSSA